VTRKGPTEKVDVSHCGGRLANAQAHRIAAETALRLAVEGDNTNPVRTLVVVAAIAYADALTARFGGVVNQQDHSAAVQALRSVLGNRLPNERARDLARIIEQKDEAQYGIRLGRLNEARSSVEALQRFGDWAETLLASA
jgi:hypothetical protein